MIFDTKSMAVDVSLRRHGRSMICQILSKITTYTVKPDAKKTSSLELMILVVEFVIIVKNNKQTAMTSKYSTTCEYGTQK